MDQRFQAQKQKEILDVLTPKQREKWFAFQQSNRYRPWINFTVAVVNSGPIHKCKSRPLFAGGRDLFFLWEKSARGT
jgi:hypothetical protein